MQLMTVLNWTMNPLIYISTNTQLRHAVFAYWAQVVRYRGTRVHPETIDTTTHEQPIENAAKDELADDSQKTTVTRP